MEQQPLSFLIVIKNIRPLLLKALFHYKTNSAGLKWFNNFELLFFY